MFEHIKRKIQRRSEKSKNRRLKAAKKEELARISELIKRNIDNSRRQVLVISFNNGVYVKSMVEQLINHGLQPIVIDNCSSSQNSIDILRELKCTVVHSNFNFGHNVGFESPVYEALPDNFGYTDPDLKLSSDLPANFYDVLLRLTKTYSSYKAGFALRISDNKNIKMKFQGCSKPFKPEQHYTIEEWEQRFWSKRLIHSDLEIYSAPIDTTFAVYNKHNFMGDFFDAVRVAGQYTATHLPWHPELDIMGTQQKLEYQEGNISNTWNQDLP